MTVLSIDQPHLVSMAANPKYSWMASLRPLRVWQVGHGGRNCCGKTKAAVPNEVFKQVATGAQFARDMSELKARMMLSKLIVNVNGYRQAL